MSEPAAFARDCSSQVSAQKTGANLGTLLGASPSGKPRHVGTRLPVMLEAEPHSFAKNEERE